MLRNQSGISRLLVVGDVKEIKCQGGHAWQLGRDVEEGGLIFNILFQNIGTEKDNARNSE
jgi:hypothetical protein